MAVAATQAVSFGQRAAWRPKLGILGNFTEANVQFAHDEGFSSIGLWADPGTSLDPDKVTDADIERVRQSLRRSGLHLSVVGAITNHIDPDPAKRAQTNAYFVKVIELAGKLGAPFVGTSSGTMPGRKLKDQVAEMVSVYEQKYFKACQDNRVRILWEPWPEGPNIATGPVGYDSLFTAFGDSPYVGLQYDPSHLVRQFMDEIQTARDFADKIYDVHLKDTEILWPILRKTGIHPVSEAQWWRYRLPGFGSINWPAFFTVLMDAGYQGAMNIEHEDPAYGYPFQGDQFPSAYMTGFRMAHAYLRQYVPAFQA
jgi:sugar phosphate isomerase/epimerase